MKNIFYILLIALLVSCSQTENSLPIFGQKSISNSGDTIYSSIQAFEFINQDSLLITEHTFDKKIYIADFIFLSCPSICPIMNSELKKVYDEFKSNPHVYFLSHTIDPESDSVPRLKEYADALGVNSRKWFFVTGNKDSIYSTAEKSYFATAFPDKNTPGGYIHSGNFLLIDIHRHIRGVYDGTNPEETKRLIQNLKQLLKEQLKVSQ